MPKHANKKAPRPQQRRSQPYSRDSNSASVNGQQLKAKPQQHARSLKAASALLTSVHRSSLMQLLQDTGAELAEKGITGKHPKHGKGRARQQEQQQQAMKLADVQQVQQQQPAVVVPATARAAAPAAAVQPEADINALLSRWSLQQPNGALQQQAINVADINALLSSWSLQQPNDAQQQQAMKVADINALLSSWSLKQPNDAEQQQEEGAAGSSQQGSAAEQPRLAEAATTKS